MRHPGVLIATYTLALTFGALSNFWGPAYIIGVNLLAAWVVIYYSTHPLQYDDEEPDE